MCVVVITIILTAVASNIIIQYYYYTYVLYQEHSCINAPVEFNQKFAYIIILSWLKNAGRSNYDFCCTFVLKPVSPELS